MSYTRKKVEWERCIHNNSSIVNEYGDIKRAESIQVLVRKQPHQEVYKDTDSREVLTKSYFYVDPRVEPNAFSIEKMDKLDGETILEVYAMCDLNNKVKMIRFISK